MDEEKQDILSKCGLQVWINAEAPSEMRTAELDNLLTIPVNVPLPCLQEGAHSIFALSRVASFHTRRETSCSRQESGIPGRRRIRRRVQERTPFGRSRAQLQEPEHDHPRRATRREWTSRCKLAAQIHQPRAGLEGAGSEDAVQRIYRNVRSFLRIFTVLLVRMVWSGTLWVLGPMPRKLHPVS